MFSQIIPDRLDIFHNFNSTNMKNFNLNSLGVQELNNLDMKEVGGGWVWAFIAGAIIGGMVYDAYKALSKEIIEAQIKHPEYYDGPVHSQR